MLESAKQLLLENLVKEGYRILILKSFDSIQYWSVSEFNPNTTGSEGIDFSKLVGINITHFFDTNSGSAIASSLVVSNLEKFIEPKIMMHVKISKNTEWQLFTA